jgi:hypothetical protein
MWFIFAFSLSVQDAFGELGANSTAHDLALGCLLAWFPVLIMGSIVDRNPIAATAIGKKLSTLVDHVRHALDDKHHRDRFIDTFKDQPDYQELKLWIENVANKGQYMKGFFVDFAGQGRVRWHYGAAHPILSDIENCYIAEKGRNWLANEREARASLVLGPINEEGLVWFDLREFWQVLSAVVIVAGSCGGAFILSYFTPTVGLGCRSGGYTIFFSVALGLLVVEMIVWLLLSPYEFESPLLTRAGSRLHSHVTFNRWEDDAQLRWGSLKRRASGFLAATGNLFVRCAVAIAILLPWKDRNAAKSRVESACAKMRDDLGNMPKHRRWELFFFRPVETFNTIWLIYIVCAQVFGWYKTCYCVSSIWAGGGGYLDFSQQDVSNSKDWVLVWWTTGTVLTASVLALSMFYITVEWCQQSFLSTEDYSEAMTGLRMTRRYRSVTFFVRRISRAVLWATLDQLEFLAIIAGVIKKRQKTLLWTKNHTWKPDIPRATAPTTRNEHPLSPSIELTDYDATHAQVQDTPAMAHSLFPPTRPRNESDASLSPFDSPNRPRASNESSAPLMQRLSQAYQYGETEGRPSGEGRVSFETPFLAQEAAVGREKRWLGTEDTVFSRQGYRRANSDPGSLPDFGGDMGQGGLGLRFDNVDLERGSS